jgi:diaminopimelate epimerase
MSGSGNDFVFFDMREDAAPELETTETIRSISARGTGVGADGVVFLTPGTSDS